METSVEKRLVAHLPDARQAFRVTLGALIAFIAYRALGLPQGYWAVFTVVIVMQGSIANTLGAATDRLIGTIAGAVLGGVAAVIFPRTGPGLMIALALVLSITAFAAAARPRLRVAPITAVILLLSQPQGLTPEGFVIDRIIEIALGGFIGVAISTLVLPVRSGLLAIAHAAAVIDRIQELLLIQADQVERSEPLAFSAEHAALRKAIGAVEQAMADAERERSAHLAAHDMPPAIPRTLWRVRTDLVLVARALDHPLPQTVAGVLVPATSALLRAEAGFAGRCAAALRARSTPERGDADTHLQAFTTAFAGLRQSGMTRPLEFADASQVFGLAFALERLNADLSQLGDRIAEFAAGTED